MNVIRLPTRYSRIVIAGAAWLIAGGRKLPAQDIGPVSFRDSLVMRQVAFRAPCPNPVPKGWTLADSTLGRPPRCSLLEVAARAVAQSLRARSQRAGTPDPWNPLCARIAVLNNTGSTGLPGDWVVVFDLATDLPAYVVIDRQTGDIGLTLIGSAQIGNRARCLSG